MLCGPMVRFLDVLWPGGPYVGSYTPDSSRFKFLYGSMGRFLDFARYDLSATKNH